MTKLKKRLPMSVAVAIAIHIVAALFLVVSFQMKREHAPVVAPTVDTVMAEVIDVEKLAEQKRRREEEIRLKELERKKRLAEQQRLAREKLEKEKHDKELAAKRALEKKKAQQAREREELKRKKIAEAKRLAQEKKRREQERRAAEREAEKKRLSEILAQEEAALKAAELEAQRIAKAREMDKLIRRYQDSIRSKVQSRWRKPLNTQPHAWCKVYVQQTPSGYVETVVVEECSTNDTAFRRSVEEAVRKSEPLPKPPSPELFDRELRFTFAPEEM